MSEPAKDFDLEHWKEVCYAHEAELEWLRAENARLREATSLKTAYAEKIIEIYNNTPLMRDLALKKKVKP